jgi:hypothetical protein
MAFTALSAAAQSAYAELFEIARQQDVARSVSNLSGSFNKKQVRGSTYWYYQYTEVGTGKLRQLFVGPDSPKLQQLVETSREKSEVALGAAAKAAVALGCASETPAHYRIIRRLNEIGFFHVGGILIGTHAFLAMGNMLGVGWGELSRTQDLDFAHAGRRVELALPASLEIETGDAIATLESGFLPVPGFRPGEKTATFMNNKDRHLRIDFLTPMVGGKEQVNEHEGLGVPLQPLRFLEFLLEDIQQAAIISALGATVVNIPDAVRYALHKLLVFVERRAVSPQKARKDLAQAAALLEVLSTYRADDVIACWSELLERGPGWRKRAKAAMSPLGERAPGLTIADEMASLVARPRAPAKKAGSRASRR